MAEISSTQNHYNLAPEGFESSFVLLATSGTAGYSYKFPVPENFSYGTKFDWSSEDLHHLGDKLMSGIRASVEQGNFKTTGDFYNALSIGNVFTETEYGGIVKAGAFDIVRNKLTEWTRKGLDKVHSQTSVEVLEKELKKAYGVTYNPNKQLYFNGLDLEDFDMKFSLAPTSSDMASNMKTALLKLNNLVHPELSEDNQYFKYPSFFDITLMCGGMILFHEKALAITSINIGFADEGSLTWHSDGFPTCISLDLAFKETKIRAKKNGSESLDTIVLFNS